MQNGRVSGTTTYLAKEFEPVKGLKGLGVFFGFGLTVSSLYATTGIGLPCPFRTVTGWNCPLCGGTRMGQALLDLDLPAAFVYNPVALISLIVVTVLGMLWVIEALGGPKVRPPAAITDRARRIHPTQWALAALTLAIVYTVARNLI